jgi:hypothetical protein
MVTWHNQPLMALFSTDWKCAFYREIPRQLLDLFDTSGLGCQQVVKGLILPLTFSPGLTNEGFFFFHLAQFAIESLFF